MIRTGSSRLPTLGQGVFQVWKRNLKQFQHSWQANLLWIVIEPTVILMAMGYGLGAFVDSIQGYSYVDYFFPALVCISAMVISFFESTYGAFPKMASNGIYSAMVLTPLEPAQIAWGEVLWASTKGLFSALGIALVGSLFGLGGGWNILLALPIIFLQGLVFAGFGLALTTRIRNYDGVIYPTSGLVIPMSLICGTYFPISVFPNEFQYILNLLPLTHSVEIVRGIVLGNLNALKFSVGLLVLCVYAGVFISGAKKNLESKLKV